MKSIFMYLVLVSLFGVTTVFSKESGEKSEALKDWRASRFVQSVLAVWTYPSSVSDYISPASSAGAINPQVAVSDNGDAVIVWQQVSSSQYRIFKSEYRSGTWTHPSSLSDFISPSSTTAAVNPQVSINSTGETVIVWQQVSGQYAIFKSEYRSGTWIHPSSINDYISPASSAGAINPQVAVSDNGEAVITWQQVSGQYRIFKSEYRGGTWTHPSSVSDYFSPTSTGGAVFPQVSINSTGETVIVWQQVSGQYAIFKAEYY